MKLLWFLDLLSGKAGRADDTVRWYCWNSELNCTYMNSKGRFDRDESVAHIFDLEKNIIIRVLSRGKGTLVHTIGAVLIKERKTTACVPQLLPCHIVGINVQKHEEYEICRSGILSDKTAEWLSCFEDELLRFDRGVGMTIRLTCLLCLGLK